MSNCPAILVDLIVIAPFVRLVSKEMNRFVVYARDFLLVLEMLQTVRLIPSGREDVERDLATDGECKTEIRELFLQGRHEFFTYLVLLVEFVKFVPFLDSCISAYGRDVDHAIPESRSTLCHARICF